MKTSLIRTWFLVVVILSLPSVTQGAGEPPAPSVVAATVVDGFTALVGWVPGVETPPMATYNVYGVNGSTYTLLEEGVTGLSAVVPAGHSTYAITTTVDGIESSPTESAFGKCAYIVQHYPFVEIRDCPVVGRFTIEGP